MNFKQETRKKVGLALSGGFIRSSASIGIIEVLEENNIPIDIISGCSSGAAVAAAYAAGTLPELKKRLIEGSRKDYWKVIFEPTFPKEGFLKGKRNQKFFEEFVDDKNFVEMDKKLIIAATDIMKMEEVFITEGKVSEAIISTTAVPGIFVPVKKDGKILIDGGNFNMIPSKPLYDQGADYVIAAWASRRPNIITRTLANLKKLRKREKIICPKNNCEEKNFHIFRLIFRAISLSVNQIYNFYHHSYPYDILIRPEIEHIKRYQVNSAAFCIEEGRKAAQKIIPQIKRDLGL